MSKTRPRQGRAHSPADEPAACRLLLSLRSTPEIFSAIENGPTQELALQAELRRRYPDDLVRAALKLADLRNRAAAKFRLADRMWFDRIGLEQATSETVARHKALRFSGSVDDLCCGVGGDCLALAARSHVRAVDLRESMTLITDWNAEVYGVADRVAVTVGDAADFLDDARLVHVDPDRRGGQRRAVRLEHFEPSLEFLWRLIEARPGGAIKLSPASNFGGRFPGCEIELVSLRGECKEATVWFGSLAGDEPFRATLLPAGETIAGDPLSVEVDVLPLSGMLYDPDAAVVRSGLLDVVADQLGIHRLDREEEYLSGEMPGDSSFVTPFAVLADLPNNEKQIRRYFREHPFGTLEIKCRHIPIDIPRWRRQLSLAGTDPVTLIFARVDGRSRALVCQRGATVRP